MRRAARHLRAAHASGHHQFRPRQCRFTARSARQRSAHLHHAHECLRNSGAISDFFFRGDRYGIQFPFEPFLNSVQGMQRPFHFDTVFLSHAGVLMTPARSSRTNTRARARAARYPLPCASVPTGWIGRSRIFSYSASSTAISVFMRSPVSTPLPLADEFSGLCSLLSFFCPALLHGLRGFLECFSLVGHCRSSFRSGNYSTAPHHTSNSRKKSSLRKKRGLNLNLSRG